MPVTSGQGNPDWTREETILALDLMMREFPRCPDKHSREVRELSDVLRLLPLHPEHVRKANFRNPSGAYLKLQNLLSLHPSKSARKGLTTSRMDKQVWAEFHDDPSKLARAAEAIRDGIQLVRDENLSVPEAEDDDEGAPEGGFVNRIHRARERKKGLRKKKLKEAASTVGIRCEACRAKARIKVSASEAAAEFEVHHRRPLADGLREKTKLADLAVLCACCHRLIHALMRAEKRFVPVEDLRGRFV